MSDDLEIKFYIHDDCDDDNEELGKFIQILWNES